MKLSEAMRLGGMLKPQGTGSTLRDGRTCALGAALEAVGEPIGGYWGRVVDIWPVARRYATYPGTRDEHRGKMMLVLTCCWILNDSEDWTREQIADWVEGIERAQEQQTTPQPVAVEA